MGRATRLALLGELCLAVQWCSAQVLASAHQPPSSKQQTTEQRSLRTVLLTLMRQRQVEFIFDERILPEGVVNTHRIQADWSLERILSELLQDTGLHYRRVRENTYLILATAERRLDRVNNATAKPTDAQIVKNQGTLPLPTALQSLPLAITPTVEQERAISGTVIDAQNNQPIPGVSIVIKGTQRGTVTDTEGRYRLTIPEGSQTLVFSYVGYINQEIVVTERSVIDISLSADDKTLNEVVVVGYGTQSRRNVTGAVSKIDMKQTETLPATNVTQAIRGRVAGVQFTDSGRPGQGGNILVRGTRSINAGNNPLIVVDGIFFNGNLADINPNDIETMEVLKDASAAAIYGSRAANGVILITSKRGTSEKPSIRVNAFYGLSDWSNRIQLLTPERYIQKTLDWRRQAGLASDPDKIDTYLQAPEVENYRQGRTIDPWQEVSQRGRIQSYDLSVSGRSERTNYYLSGALVNEQGIVYNDQANRLSFRANLETTIAPWLQVGLTSQYARRDLSGVEGNVGLAYRMSPYATLFTDAERTDPIPYPVDDQLMINPLFNAKRNQNEEVFNNLFANFYAKVDIPFLKGLQYRINFSPNLRWQHNYTFVPIYERYGMRLTGNASKVNRQDYDWVMENIVTYSRQFGTNHAIDATLLYGRNHFGWESTTATATNFFNDANGWNNLGLGQVQQSASSASRQDGISSMLRINYRFRDRYLFTVTGRRDGSSVFGQQQKFALFPSAAFAWIASDEKFLAGNRFINLLKLRLSYGSVGNQAINPYQSLSRSSTAQYVFGDGSPTYTGVFPANMANPNLTWETTVSANAALDFELFKGRVSGTIDVYNMNTRDLLLLRSLPSMTGFASVWTNLGATNNRGIELSLTTNNLRRGKFSWTSTAVFSTNRNRITSIYGSDLNEDGIEDDDVGNRWFIGQPVLVAFDYVFDGIYQNGETLPTGYQPGFIRVRDLNGDNQITPIADRRVIGQLEPRYRWGLTNEFRYGNLSLSVFINAMQGWISPMNLLNIRENFPDRPANFMDADWWTAENQSNTRPSLTFNNPLGIGYYASRDFVRLQDASLAYTVPGSWLSKRKLGTLRLYVSGRNLVTWSVWPGFDPENGNSGLGNLFPAARTVSLGLNLGF